MYREKAEKIFNEHAKNIMKKWDIDEFKKSHPKLFETIIVSIMDGIITE